jgi:hypothetical protein
MRFRYIFLLLGSALVIALMLATDPDSGFFTQRSFGAGTIAMLVVLLQSILYVALLHYSRKGLFDYLDLEELYRTAKVTPEGASRAMVAIAIAMVAIAIVIHAAVR